jgi:hypothetical protein
MADHRGMKPGRSPGVLFDTQAACGFSCSALKPGPQLRLLRNRCGVCISAIKRAARIGPMQGIWRGSFALDAMPKEDARLFARVSRSRDWSGTEAEGIRVSVADNGSGIHASALSKIFEAFFTTKAATGTGLGLWLSREIVHKHGGRIHVRSRANALRTGTIFSVFWPCRQDTSVLLERESR